MRWSFINGIVIGMGIGFSSLSFSLYLDGFKLSHLIQNNLSMWIGVVILLIVFNLNYGNDTE